MMFFMVWFCNITDKDTSGALIDSVFSIDSHCVFSARFAKRSEASATWA